MSFVLILAMIGVPILEIAVFIEAGERFGLWPTLGAVILTAVVGGSLLRHQGFTTFVRAQQNLNEGRFPVAEVFDGLCLLFAGALLLTPGFVTAAVGLLLFFPPLRASLRKAAGRYLVASGRVAVFTDGPPADGGAAPGGRRPDGTVIDGEYEDVTERRRSRDDRPGNHRQVPKRRSDGRAGR